MALASNNNRRQEWLCNYSGFSCTDVQNVESTIFGRNNFRVPTLCFFGWSIDLSKLAEGAPQPEAGDDPASVSEDDEPGFQLQNEVDDFSSGISSIVLHGN